MSLPCGSQGARGKSVKRLLDWLLLAVGLGGLVWYLSRFSGEFGRLANMSVGTLVLLSGVVLLGHLIFAAKLRTSVRIFGASLTIREAFLLVEAGSFMNILPLHMGTALRALYLKKVARLKYVNYGLSFVVTQCTAFLVAGVIGLLFLCVIGGTFIGLQLVFLGYIIIAVGVLMGGYMARSARLLELGAGRIRSRWWKQLLTSLQSGIGDISSQPRAVMLWFGFDVLSNFVLGMRFFVVGQSLGYGLDLAPAMVMQGITRIAAIFTVVASGTIGVREALTGLASSGLGKAAVAGVMIATIDRIIVTMWFVVLGSVSLFVVRRRVFRATGRPT